MDLFTPKTDEDNKNIDAITIPIDSSTTKVIDACNPRTVFSELLYTKSKEVGGLKLRSLRQAEAKAGVSSDADILRGCFVYIVENHQGPTEILDAALVR